MELQFHKKEITCLHPIKCQVQNQEQTQELRLDDTMPQIDRVLCAWGQVLLRGKQWHSGSVQVSGGVMVWVLYAPEEGNAECVETWVPFQVKMDIPQSEIDGKVLVNPLLRSVDARNVNARKLMVRVDVGVQLCTTIPQTTQVYRPEELPEDVQILENTYPVQLPMEMGEKEFLLDEILSLPGSSPAMEKLLYYRIQPELIDRKVMADKVVFRGSGLLHVLYRGTDGQPYSWDFELPFSQYAELTGQYGQDASARIVPAVTSLELVPDGEGRLQLKAGLLGQYMIYDRKELTVAEDAYSTKRDLTAAVEPLQLPAVLDMQVHSMRCEQSVPADGTRVADVTFLPDQPAQLQREDTVELDLSGKFLMLYCDPQGNLETAAQSWGGQWSHSAHEDCKMQTFGAVSGTPVGILGGGNATLRADMLLDTAASTMQTIPMITGLTLTDRESQKDRPSIVLRRLRQDSLWELAKQTGSTVDAIRKANQLTEDPAEDQMLLIPVV